MTRWAMKRWAMKQWAMKRRAIVHAGAAALAGLAVISSCSVPGDFSCLNTNQCGDGQCIAGACAFPSDDCLSGLRYGELSPASLAGTCVVFGVADEVGTSDDPTLDTNGSSSSMGSSESDSGSTSSGSTSADSTTADSTSADSTSADSTTAGTTTSSLPDTVIAHYSFDDIALPFVLDSSGNGYDAEMDNSQPTVAGVVGEGLEFGNLDRVIVPLEVLAGRTEFTIEWYMKVTQTAPLRQFLVYYGDELDTAAKPNLTVYVEYSIAPQQTSRVVWTQAQATGLIGTTNMRNSNWRHVAVTFDGQGMKVYVDHFLDDSDPFVPNLLSGNLDWIQIGGLPGGFGSFTGVLDELRFSEGALTPAQMQPVP